MVTNGSRPSLPRRTASLGIVAQAQAGARISVRDMGSRMRDMRASMDESEDERLKSLMAGLRGSNINVSDFASSDVRMNLVEIARGDDDDEELPLTYDPEAIAAYWDRRPVSIITRILQLLGENSSTPICVETIP